MNNLTQVAVLVTRPEPEGSELCQLIEAHGGQAVHLPTMVIAPPPDPEGFQQSLSLLGVQDWLIFISPQAVYASIAAIRRAWPTLPPQVKFAAMGEGTARALLAAGYVAAIQPTAEWSSAGLLATPELQAVAGQRIAIIRGVGGREELADVLRSRGAEVTSIIAYQRVLPTINVAEKMELLKQHRINCIVCTSCTGLSNLLKLFGAEQGRASAIPAETLRDGGCKGGESRFSPFVQAKAWLLRSIKSRKEFPRFSAGTPGSVLQTLTLIVPSERIKMLAQDLGFQTIWVARNASHPAILEALSVVGRNK